MTGAPCGAAVGTPTNIPTSTPTSEEVTMTRHHATLTAASTPTHGAGPRIVVDRVACTGHGICAGLLPSAVDLDEWGYPVLLEPESEPGAPAPRAVRATPSELRAAVRLCPTQALRLRTTHHDLRSAS